VGVKFQGSFTSGIYIRAKVSNVTLRVNCQANSSKGRNTKGRGSIGFGLLCLLANQGRVVTVGWVLGVIIGPLFVADTAEEMAVAKSETLVTLIPVFLPQAGPVLRSFPGFLSCQCLAFSAAVNLTYTSSG